MYLFFDTETTGLSNNKDHVVQLAWVLADSEGNICVEECYVIRPDGYSIPDAAARIHGISTTKACQIGQPLRFVLSRFSDVAARAKIVVAHNLSFDLGILKHDYKIAELAFPLHGKIQICTMKLSTAWCRLPKLNGSKGFKWPKLEELHFRLFGEGFDGAHDALEDSRACLRSYFELVNLGVIIPPARVSLENAPSLPKNKFQSINHEAKNDKPKLISTAKLSPSPQGSLGAIHNKIAKPTQCSQCGATYYYTDYCPLCQIKLHSKPELISTSKPPPPPQGPVGAIRNKVAGPFQCSKCEATYYYTKYCPVCQIKLHRKKLPSG